MDLEPYGRRLTGCKAAPFQPPPASGTGRFWAPDTARDGTVTVALQGNPTWRRANGGPATAAGILEAYRRSGRSVLQSLHGRFALAIADENTGETVLAVDPMGIGRLAYAVVGDAIVFSTSAEAVARFPAVNAGLANQAIFDYLFHHAIPAPATVFAGVRKLPPATHLVASRGGVRVERYWDPSFRAESVEPLPVLRAGLNEALRAAVRDCAPDSRTGAFLSGGLDSSTVAGVLSELQPPPAKTFSIGFGYPDYDELAYARIANARFRCEGHEYVIRGADIAATLHKIARAYDEPFGNSSALPAYHCAIMAREAGVDHLLAGDGGDELFAGNSRYADQRIFEWYGFVPTLVRRKLLEPVLERLPQANPPWLVRKARGYVDKANTPLPARLETWNFIFGLGPERVLEPGFLASIDLRGPFARMQEVWDTTPSDSTLQRMLYYDWHYTLADNDLRKVEVMCDLAGVRVSYPMLHHSVVDLSTRVAPGQMMPGRKLRHFYKEAMKGFLPDEIIHKKKHGFGLPFGLWLQESAELRELVFGSLSSLRSRGVIRPDFIDHLLDLHGQDDARYYGVFIWVLAMLEQWFQEHGVQP